MTLVEPLDIADLRDLLADLMIHNKQLTKHIARLEAEIARLTTGPPAGQPAPPQAVAGEGETPSPERHQQSRHKGDGR